MSGRKHRKFAFIKPRVLIADALHPLFMKGIRQLGYGYDYMPEITPKQAMAIIEKYVGVVIDSRMKIDRPFIDAAKNLRFVARAGSGMENVEVAYLQKNKIQPINSPEGNRDAVGEHTIGLLLSLLHNITKSDKEVRKRNWLREENRGEELQGKIVGIIGYGNTGSAVAEKLSGFGVKVIAYDKYRKNFSDKFAEEVEMKTIFRIADVVSFHIPLTGETKYMVNETFLDKFEKNIYLINTSRGQILKTEALIKSLKKGKVKKAALDVLENENIATLTKKELKWFDELVKSDRVIITPHIAGWSMESKEKIAKTLLDKIGKIQV